MSSGLYLTLIYFYETESLPFERYMRSEVARGRLKLIEVVDTRRNSGRTNSGHAQTTCRAMGLSNEPEYELLQIMNIHIIARIFYILFC